MLSLFRFLRYNVAASGFFEIGIEKMLTYKKAPEIAPWFKGKALFRTKHRPILLKNIERRVVE